MTTYNENSEKIQNEINKLAKLLHEPNITVTRNDPLDPTAFAVYKERQRIFTIKLVFRYLPRDYISFVFGINMGSDTMSGIFYPESPEYNKLRELYNSVADMWFFSPQNQGPNKPNLLKRLFHNIFTQKR